MKGLSKLALKRLQKEMAAPLPVGISLSPLEDDLSTWHGNLKLLDDGPYKNVVFHVLIEIPAEYPSKPPSLYFRSTIRYQNGAQTEVKDKGASVCLNILGNWSNYHSEWGTDAAGWSPSCTLETVMIQLQGSLGEMLSQDTHEVERAKTSAATLKCACGHDAAKNELFPPLTEAPAKASDSTDYRAKYEALLEEVEVLRTKAAAYDALAETFSRVGLSGGVVAKPVIKEKPRVKLTHLQCFASGLNAEDDADEIFGFGVSVTRSGSLSTPGEVLSHSAFEGGVRRSSMNEAIDFFLPIFVSDAHWKKALPLFKKNVGLIRAAQTKQQRGGGGARFGSEVEAVLALCSLMNTCVVSVSDQANAKAHDNFIAAYFCLLRVLKFLAASFKSVREYADREVDHFAKGRTDKSAVANLGDFLVLLHASSPQAWQAIREQFVAEVDARNVRWFKESALQAQTQVANRCGKTFSEACVSRRIVCFQVRFLQVAASLDVTNMVDGMVPDELMKRLKSMHGAVAEHKTWADYNAWIGRPVGSAEQRTKELIAAVTRSRECGYHGKSNGGKKGGGRRR